MRTFGLALLLGATQLSAQAPGDMVRLRLGPGAAWIKGRIIRSDSLTVMLRTATGTLASGSPSPCGCAVKPPKRRLKLAGGSRFLAGGSRFKGSRCVVPWRARD